MTRSTCCDAPLTDEAFGERCSDCKEPCGSFDHDEKKQMELNALLRNEREYQPYAVPGGRVTFGEIGMAVLGIVVIWFAVFVGYVTGY